MEYEDATDETAGGAVEETGTADVDPNEVRVIRYDRGGQLLQAVSTDEGFMLLEGYVAKPGVLTYKRGDGKEVRELIPPEELHRADSLATLGRKPVTLEHPPEYLNPDNVGEYAIGDVDGEVYIGEGGFVRVKMAVRRADGLAALRRGVRELSPGYTCAIDATPGTHPVYGAYDQVQRRRVYNHAALTERGRAGHDISLRFDSAVELLPPVEVIMHPKLIALLALLAVKRQDDAAAAPSDGDLDAAVAAVTAMQKQLSEAMPEAASAKDLRARIAALEVEIADARAKLAAAEAAVASASALPPPAEIIADATEADPMPVVDGQAPAPEEMRRDSVRNAVTKASTERIKLETLARKLRLDSVVTDKLGNGGLRKLVVTTAMPTAKKDGDRAYYEAAVDLLAGAPAQRQDAADPEAEEHDHPYSRIGEAYRARREDEKRVDAADKPTNMADALTANIRAAFEARHKPTSPATSVRA